MDAERYQRVQAIYLELFDRDADEQAARLDELCEGDAELRDAVQRLLDSGAESSGFLEEPAALTDAPPDVELPERIGPFAIVDLLGAGGMGVVYEAEQTEPRRRVALKVMRRLMDPGAVRRFRNEAQMLARLHHPGIAQVYEVGELDTGSGAQPWFAMELIEGTPLRDLARHRELSIRERLALVVQVCDTVQHAHENGIVHRDLKPANLLVGADGRVRVLDFGVAHATEPDVLATALQTVTGQLIGTVPYMSPEQVAGDVGAIDARTDVYALGVLLYELLTDRLPLPVADLPLAEAARRIAEEEPSRLGELDSRLRGDLDTIVLKAMEKDRARRYSSARALGEDLQRFLADQPIVARPPTTWYQVRKFARRHRLLVGALSVIFALLTIGIVVAYALAVQAGARAAESQRAAYRASLAATSVALANDDTESAARYHTEASEELRGWEWRHLGARLESPVLASRELDDRGGRERGAWDEDGTPLAVTVRDGRVALLDLLSGRVSADLGPAEGLHLIALAPDASGLAAACDDGELALWSDLRGGEPTRVPWTGAPPRNLELGYGAKRLLVGSEQELVVLDVASGEPVFETAQRPVGRARLVGGGERLLVADTSTISLFDVDGGSEHRSPSAVLGGGSIAASRDGTRVVLGGDYHERRTALLRVEAPEDVSEVALEGLPLLRGNLSGVAAAAFSPDGGRVATLSSGRVLVHDTHDLSTSANLTLPGPVVSVVFSGTGDELVVIEESPDRTSSARVVALSPGPSRVLPGHESYVYLVAWSPDGTLLASLDFEGHVRLWDPVTGECLATWHEHDRQVLAFADASTLLTASGAIDVATGRLTLSFQSRQGHPDTRLAAYYARAPGGSVAVLGSSGPTIVSSSDGRRFARSRDGGIGLFETPPLFSDEVTPTRLLTVPRPVFREQAKAFRADGRRFAAGADLGWIQVWDTASGDLLHDRLGHTHEIFTLRFSADGTRLVSGAADTSIRVWDAERMELLLELSGHGSYVHDLVFSPDETRIASASGDRTVRVWDTVSYAERFRQGLAEAEARRRMRPRVRELLERLGDPGLVAGALRADAALGDAELRAAERVLLASSHASLERDDLGLPAPPPAIRHRWSFDGDARDDVGGAHGTLVGGARVERGAVHLDGIDDCVELPIYRTIDELSNASVEVWAVCDARPAPPSGILDLRVTGSGTSLALTAGAPDPNGDLPIELGWYVGGLHQGRAARLAEPAALAPGRRAHLVATIDADLGRVRLYVDGELRGELNGDYELRSLGPAGWSSVGRTMDIWWSHHSWDMHYFRGSVEEVAIYDYALSEDEIAQRFRSGPR